LLLVEIEGDPARFTKQLCAAGLETITGGDGELRIQWPDATPDADRVFELAQQAGVVITQLRQQRSSLEDVFLRAVGAMAPAGSDSESSDSAGNPTLLKRQP
jgi:hypothetical protein